MSFAQSRQQVAFLNQFRQLLSSVLQQCLHRSSLIEKAETPAVMRGLSTASGLELFFEGSFANIASPLATGKPLQFCGTVKKSDQLQKSHKFHRYVSGISDALTA